MYKMQEGDAFSEKNVDNDNLKASKLLDMETYNKTNGTANNILYKIVPGTVATPADNSDPENPVAAVPAKGAYVICSFASDTDKIAIAKALRGYKDIRIDGDEDGETNYTVGAFFFHPTASSLPSTSAEDYDTTMTY